MASGPVDAFDLDDFVVGDLPVGGYYCCQRCLEGSHIIMPWVDSPRESARHTIGVPPVLDGGSGQHVTCSSEGR